MFEILAKWLKGLKLFLDCECMNFFLMISSQQTTKCFLWTLPELFKLLTDVYMIIKETEKIKNIIYEIVFKKVIFTKNAENLKRSTENLTLNICEKKQFSLTIVI